MTEGLTGLVMAFVLVVLVVGAAWVIWRAVYVVIHRPMLAFLTVAVLAAALIKTSSRKLRPVDRVAAESDAASRGQLREHDAHELTDTEHSAGRRVR